MTEFELILLLAKKFPQLTHSDITLSIQIILDSMTHALADNRRVEIRGFGSFNVNISLPGQACNPETGERFQVAAKRMPHFKPGMELKKRVL